MAGNPGWKRGGPSPNPSGRTKAQSDAARALARRIQEETRDGDELLEFALRVYRFVPGGPNAETDRAVHGLVEVELEDKKWAHGWLTDRGFGKALQVIDFAGEGTIEPALPIPDTVSDADLDAAERVLEETLAQRPAD